MNMQSSQMKARSAAAAYGSVRAEGLTPTKKTQKQVGKYIAGKITKRELRRTVVQEIRQLNSK